MIHTQWSRKPTHSTFGEFLRRKSLVWLTDHPIEEILSCQNIFFFFAKIFGAVFIVVWYDFRGCPHAATFPIASEKWVGTLCLVQGSHVKQCGGNYCKVGTSKIKENMYKVIVEGLECSAIIKSSHDWQEVKWKHNKNPIQIQKDQTHTPGAGYLLASTDWVQVTQEVCPHFPSVRAAPGRRVFSKTGSSSSTVAQLTQNQVVYGIVHFPNSLRIIPNLFTDVTFSNTTKTVRHHLVPQMYSTKRNCLQVKKDFLCMK